MARNDGFGRFDMRFRFKGAAHAASIDPHLDGAWTVWVYRYHKGEWRHHACGTIDAERKHVTFMHAYKRAAFAANNYHEKVQQLLDDGELAILWKGKSL